MSSTTTTTATLTATATEEPQQPSPLLLPSLPNDIALNCLARIPRSHHPTLSLVSKSIHSLLSSPLFHTTRSLLNCTQNVLYLSLRDPTKPSPLWYTLHRKPPTTGITTDIKKLNALIPIPPIPSPYLIGSAFVAVGPLIYVIGGSINDVLSSRVWVLDCRFQAWRSAPNMRVGREFAAAGVVDHKIYVIGGCVPDTWARSKNWVEAFDLKTQSWEPISSPVEIREKWMHGSAVIGGRIYAMADRNGAVYDPRLDCWDVAESELDLGWKGRACVIDEVLYCYDYLGKIRGYDAKEKAWKDLKGVEKGLPRFLCGATMTNLGGRLAVLWEGRGGIGKEKEIWCAEIMVERSNEGELWGRIEWSDVVLWVPTASAIIHCLAVAL